MGEEQEALMMEQKSRDFAEKIYLISGLGSAILTRWALKLFPLHIKYFVRFDQFTQVAIVVGALLTFINFGALAKAVVQDHRDKKSLQQEK